MEKQKTNMFKEIVSFFSFKQKKDETNNKELLDIDSPVEKLPIAKRTLNVLLINNILTIKQLLNTDIDLLASKKNVGKITIKEIKSIISEYENSDLQKRVVITYDENSESLDKNVIHKKELKNTIENITEEYLYNIEKVFNDEWIIKYCKKMDLKNIGMLAGVFPDEFLKNDEIIIQSIYFDEKEQIIKSKLEELGITNYPIYYTEEQLEILNLTPIEECLKKDYVGDLSAEMMNILHHPEMYPQKSKKSVLTEKNIDILLRRNALYDGTEYTLEQIKEIHDVTSREAIRQQEEKGYERVARMMIDLITSTDNDIKRIFDAVGPVIYFEKSFDKKYQTILEKILSKNHDISFELDYNHNLIIKKDSFSYSEIIDNVNNYMKTDNKTFIDREELSQVINQVLLNYSKKDTLLSEEHYNNLFNMIFNNVINDLFIFVEEDLYKYKHTRKGNSIKDKEEQIEYYLKKLYKEPVNIPQRNEELMRKNLAKLYEKLPWLNNYEGSSSIERIIKNTKNIIFCGMGMYIHIDNINADMNIVNNVISEVRTFFNQGNDSIGLLELYTKYKNELMQANIKDRYVLIGLISYINPSGIDCSIREMKLYSSNKK